MAKARSGAVLGLAALFAAAACSGSSGNAGHALGDKGIKSAAIVVRVVAFQRPLDAAPSPDGRIVYFSSTGDRGPSIVSVPAGGGAMTTLADGAPLVNPTGVAVATDGSHVYIADQLATGSGAILTVPSSGAAGPPATVADTQGRAPRGLDIVKESGADVVYFTGKNPVNGAPGVFKVPAVGGTVTTVAEGAPFIAPDSVVLTAGGDAYVTDQGSDIGKGRVYRVRGGTVTPVLDGLHLGAPAGVTLINNDATLLVSSIDAGSLSDQVLFLDLASGKSAAATKVIGVNKNSSGGLHRAHDTAVLAWADVSRSGKVYRVEP
jgi:sugar lactone lactonase YvrE